MPKEIIEATVGRMPVSWGRDQGYVQIGVDLESVRGILEMVHGWQVGLGGGVQPLDVDEVCRQIKKNAEVGGYPSTGLYATLSQRNQVNRLIALLRRARDGAFGKDA